MNNYIPLLYTVISSYPLITKAFELITVSQRSWHCSDIIMSAMGFQITGFSIVYSTVCWGTDQRKHQSSASLVFVCGVHRWPVNSPHKGTVTRKMFPFDDVIMIILVVGVLLCFVHVWYRMTLPKLNRVTLYSGTGAIMSREAAL